MTLDSASPDGKLRALTLDGGGFRGLGMLYVLKEITNAANKINRKPSDPQLRPHDIFDVVVGSSTGGLIAVLVGRLGLDCDTAIKEYEALGKTLFGTNREDFMKNVLLPNKKFDAATIQRYHDAVGSLVSRYSTAAPNFNPNSVTKSNTGVVLQPDVGTVPLLVTSAESSLSSVWPIQDIIRATTAAQRYLPSYTPTGSTKAYKDSAYAGQSINPTTLPAVKKLWDDNLGVLVNIGQWFPSVDVPDKANLTKADAKKFVDEFLGGVPPDPKVATEDTILIYLKQIKLAKDLAAKVVEEQSLKPSGTIQRLDPPLGPANLGEFELVDVFFADMIKKFVQNWIADNAKLFTDLAPKLVKAAPNDKVPEKNPNVHPYNDVLDKEKPREMLEYLNTYHVIFVIDDSTSMIMTDNYTGWDDRRWRQAQASIGPIADFTFKNNVKTVDMGFLHFRRDNPFKGIQNEAGVLQIFQQARPPQTLSRVQRTPTGQVLKFFLDQALQELNSKVANSEAYKKIPPTDIIVLTDGEADDDPKSVMVNTRKEMDRNKHNPNYIGVQFVQIGNSPIAKIRDLTKGEYGDMADLVPSDGTDLTAEKLTRILLGANHPSVRRKLGAADLQ